MRLILGLDDFGKAVSEDLDFVDKTLFVKELLDNTNVEATVIVRPRRFGKTFNLSMLQHFFASEVNGLKTAGMFDRLQIAKAGESYMQEQGKYPVVSISFKAIKEREFEEAYNQLVYLISQVYIAHQDLLNSEALLEHEKADFLRVLNREVTPVLVKNALYKLTEYLHRHHGVKPWLLIDEYDTPIQTAYVHDYYAPMIELMRGIFGNALKGNPNIHRAVITGILRIAKENLFSGVNNLKVYSVLNDQYAEHFGFTESEINKVLAASGLSHLAESIKSWYNGYHIGKYKIYNPWSIANCVNERGLLKPYWLNTSDNLLIKQVMARAGASVKQKFELLIQGQPINGLIGEAMTFADLDQDEDAPWALLLFAGYLTSLSSEWIGLQQNCRLIPPNQEVAYLYPNIIASWFSESIGRENYHYLLQSLTQGDLETFLRLLRKFLLESASYFDVKGNAPEKFYHGFVMGLIVGLMETHTLHSNKESDYGRYDVMIIPKDKNQLGIIIEFKIADTAEELQPAAEAALQQITAQHYASQLEQQGINRIMQLGLSFFGKTVAWAADFPDSRYPI